MTIKEVLTLEAGNIDKIYLIKEGFFWRCYEYSAYRFVKHIRNYQVIKKFIKTVKQEVCYIGFPVSSVDKIKDIAREKGFDVKIENQLISITGINCRNEDFEQWKEQIKIPLSKDSNFLWKKIKKYPLSVKTPIETMQFVAELQACLKNDKIING